MKLLILLIIVIIGYSVSGQAQENQRFEFAAAPLFGYSSSNGLALGANLEFGYAITARVQVFSTVAYYAYTGNGNGSSEYSAGLQFNFSEDTQNSSFLGVGWGNEQSYDYYRGAFAFGRFGYRRLLSERYGISWAPVIRVMQYYGEDNRGSAETVMAYVQPLRFSMSF